MSNPPCRTAPRPRHDGWSAERQLAFLNALAISRSVTKAARAVGMSREGAYRLRARSEGALFAVRWDQILRGRFIAAPPALAPRSAGHERHALHSASRCASRIVPRSTS